MNHLCQECGNHSKNKIAHQMCNTCNLLRNICPKCKGEKNSNYWYCKVCSEEV